jgi:hypothetical protein
LGGQSRKRRQLINVGKRQLGRHHQSHHRSDHRKTDLLHGFLSW